MPEQFTYKSSSRPCTFNPILHTSRLTLTIWDPQSPSDIEFCLALFKDAKTKAKSNSLGVDTHEKLEAFRISTCLLSKYTPLKLPISGPAIYTVRYGANDPSATPIGLISVCNRVEDFPPDIGWSILSECQRQGFAAEAAERVFNYFMDEFQGGFKNAIPPLGITAILNLENKASAGVARRLGLVDLGDVNLQGAGEGKFPVYGTASLLVEGEKPFSRDKNTLYRFGWGEAGRRTVELIFGTKETPKRAEEEVNPAIEVS